MMTNEPTMTQTGYLAPAASSAQPRDYAHVAKAMAYLDANWRNQPSLDDIADHVGLSQAHFQRLFQRWAGVSPKTFLHLTTLDHARQLLTQGANLLDTAYEVGLSGPGRLHDLFVKFEAMTPGDYKLGGDGITILYGFHSSPFGDALLMVTARGLAGLAFADGPEERRAVLADMTRRWPKAAYMEDDAATDAYAAQIFNTPYWQAEAPLKIVLMGSEFDVSVWQALLAIPRGAAVTYGDLAQLLGKPKAARAVGSAVGRNPISFVVPCHRVLRKSGALGGYHWGLARKRAIIGWEAAAQQNRDNESAQSVA